MERAAAFSQVGALHTFCPPHSDLWRALLAPMSVAGLDTVAVSFFWTYHRPSPGFCDFTSARPIGRRLYEAAHAGLWLIPRVGPCLCPDLDSCGTPAWAQRRSHGVAELVEPGRVSAAGLLRHKLLIARGTRGAESGVGLACLETETIAVGHRNDAT